MKKILYIVFVFNFLFSLLTTILPLLVFAITNSSATSGYILSTFMISLLLIRILLIKYNFKLNNIAITGLVFYSLGFFLLLIASSNILYFYIGATLLGIGVGAVAPVLITLITSINENTNKMVGLHNSFMGAASATAPFAGVYFYYNFPSFYLYSMLFTLSISVLLISFFIKLNNEDSNSEKLNKPANNSVIAVFLNKEYLSNYSIFLLVSISYGSIIAYLPIYLEQISLRIDIFYFLFWAFFIISQVYVPRIKKVINERYLLALFMLLLSISTLLISILNNYIGLITIAVTFGFCYGALTNLFYIRIAVVKDEKLKTNAFSIFGLMSYLGVGLGAFIFISIADVSLRLLFVVSSMFPIVGLLLILILYLVERLKSMRVKTIESNSEIQNNIGVKK
ncbi:MFS transporter [Sporosarcina limicola]|uniref:MFS family permease n=1 Tax=Sporosarcina limicola TaxID=34101 RepID=A0A927MPQ2_9BACL|nr:MFS transporter [Sporosarcina limicola]MBE1555101.1 MFS family permease [Sporosarcina limicola]